jgi:hypothetical protein
MPFDPNRYPPDWQDVRARIRARSGGRCEGPGARPLGSDVDRCEAQDGELHPRTASRVVLTVAHLDHRPLNCDPANLRDMCQDCHLAYDREVHARVRRENRKRQRALGDLFAGEYPPGRVHASDFTDS